MKQTGNITPKLLTWLNYLVFNFMFSENANNSIKKEVFSINDFDISESSDVHISVPRYLLQK